MPADSDPVLPDIASRIGAWCCDTPGVESAWRTRRGTFFVATIKGVDLRAHVARLEDEVAREFGSVTIRTIALDDVSRMVSERDRERQVFMRDD